MFLNDSKGLTSLVQLDSGVNIAPFRDDIALQTHAVSAALLSGEDLRRVNICLRFRTVGVRLDLMAY
jgi:hypothetical protein